MTSASPRDSHATPDPSYLHARREAVFAIGLFVVCLLWSVGYCYFTGYVGADFDASQLRTIWGMPRWVFFGIVVPWLFADVATAWFCFRFMKLDDLGAVQNQTDSQDDRGEAPGSEESV